MHVTMLLREKSGRTVLLNFVSYKVLFPCRIFL
uniref:Uncharacterized protein n=1 Tax=Arundo donax TaxID=35708 RepID=A0A0A9EEX1_ARUDO